MLYKFSPLMFRRKSLNSIQIYEIPLNLKKWLLPICSKSVAFKKITLCGYTKCTHLLSEFCPFF